jgi:hypothetical protein
MNTDLIKDFLLYCLVFNYVILIIWFGVFSLAHDWIFDLHKRWFTLSIEIFDSLHYMSMAIYKIAILILNIAPLVAMWLIS